MKARGWLVRVAGTIGAGALLGLSGSPAAMPTNLLVNGTFDTVVDPWTGTSWKSLDAAGSPGSGSARATNTYDFDYENWFYGQQCIDTIVPGARYTLSGQAMVPSGQSRLLGVAIGTQGFTNPAAAAAGARAGPTPSPTWL